MECNYQIKHKFSELKMKVEDTELGDPGERNLLLQSPAGHMVSYIYFYHKNANIFLRVMSYDI